MDLGQLISSVHERSASEAPLDRLSAAVQTRTDLDELADSLVGHFVDQARRAGHSWAEIGGALGVTRQAAQQRFVEKEGLFTRLWHSLSEGGHLTRFTKRAREVVVAAQEEARSLDHGWIGTEHLLLGLLHGDGIATRVLEAEGVTLDATREQVVAVIGRGDTPPKGDVAFTPRSKTVLELSLQEALQLGHDYIGTEHLLLGLLREGEGVGAQVLRHAEVDHDRVRDRIVRMLAGLTSGP